MNLTEQLRSIAKEASIGFPIEEVIETCFSEARAGNYQRDFTPSDFGFCNRPLSQDGVARQRELMDMVVTALRERGLVVYIELDRNHQAYQCITVDWSEVK